MANNRDRMYELFSRLDYWVGFMPGAKIAFKVILLIVK